MSYFQIKSLKSTRCFNVKAYQNLTQPYSERYLLIILADKFERIGSEAATRGIL